MVRPFTAALAAFAALVLTAACGAQELEALQTDAFVPVLGNPDGDVTIVEYFDYQCPFCRRAHPQVMEAVERDGNVRLILRDWPVFGETSEYASRMVLATVYQDRYAEALDAVMTFEGSFARQSVDEALVSAGVDLERASADLEANADEIEAFLARNDAQMRAIGARGTPAFVVGDFLIPGMVEAGMLLDAIEAARERQGG